MARSRKDGRRGGSHKTVTRYIDGWPVGDQGRESTAFVKRAKRRIERMRGRQELQKGGEA